MRRLPTSMNAGLAQLVTSLAVAIAATVAVCLGHISEATYVALLAGGVVGGVAASPVTTKIAEGVKPNG